MGRGRRLFGRRRPRSPRIDLFGAAIGLPFYRSIHKGAKKKASDLAADYDTEDDEETSVNAKTSQSDSSFSDSDDDVSSGAEISTTASRSKSSQSKSRKASISTSSKSRRRKPLVVSPPHRKMRRHSRSVSRRRTNSTLPSPPVSSLVRPPPIISSFIPSNLSFQKTCMNPTATSFPNPLHQPFANLPIQQQPMYYQPPVAIVQNPPHAPQYAAPNLARPVLVYPQPAPQLAPQKTPQHVPRQATVHIRDQSSIPSNKNSTSHSSPGWANGSGPLSERLEQVQMKIDQKMADLARTPRDSALRADLRKLQDRLNAMLNSTIAQKKNSEHEYFDGIEIKTGTGTESRNDLPHKRGPSIADALPNRSDRGGGRSAKTPRNERHTIIESPREESLERVPFRHICSGCGCVRSTLFHEQHPLVVRGKRHFNFCDACRKRKIHRGIAARYHFCFSCGMVRSRSFHRQHPILPGDPIIPNHCGPCLKHIRINESLADSSIIGSVCETDVEPVEDQESIVEGSGDSLRAHLHRNRAIRRRDESFPIQTGLRGDLSKGGTVRSRKKRSSTRTPVREPALPKSVGSASTLKASPELTYCPTRNIGSADRRAQRDHSDRLEPQRQKLEAKTDKPKTYRAPYIEEPMSAVSSCRDHSIAGLSANTRELKESKPASMSTEWKNTYPDEQDVDETPDATRNRSSIKPLGKSIDSDLSSGSRKSSLKSTGSKTVRFKNSVDIRMPCSSGAQQESSPIKMFPSCMGDSQSGTSRRAQQSPLLSHDRDNFSSTPSCNESNYEGDRIDRGAGSSARSPPSPGFSQGAFSKTFEPGFDDWHGFNNQRSYVSDDMSTGKEAQDSRFRPETPKSPKTFHTSGFGSFFDRSKNAKSPGDRKRTGPHQSTASSPDSYRFKQASRDFPEEFRHRFFPDRRGSSSPDSPSAFSRRHEPGVYTVFTDYDNYNFGEDDSFSQNESCYSRDNPYYQPRHRHGSKFASEGYWGGDGAPRSWEAKKPGNSWVATEERIPKPIIEEASSIRSASPESRTMLIEHNSISDSESESRGTADSAIEPVTSDEDIDEIIITEGAHHLLKPAADAAAEVLDILTAEECLVSDLELGGQRTF